MNFKKFLTYFSLFAILFSFSFCFPCYGQENELIQISSITELEETEDESGFKVEFSSFGENAILIVALYDGNTLVDVKNCNINATDTEKNVAFETSDISKASKVKAFIWDSLNGLKPVSETKEKMLKAQFNYKRNDVGKQSFLYRFGTIGKSVEISISEDSGYKMSDLDLIAVVGNGNTVSDGDIFTVSSSSNYSKNIKFTGNYCGIINLNLYLKDTNILQDTMQVEILKDYKNLSMNGDLTNNLPNCCLVPTLSNNGKFEKNFTLSENSRCYGNDCTVESNNSKNFVASENSYLENIRLKGFFTVDETYDLDSDPTLMLNQGVTLKNAYVYNGATCIYAKGDGVTLEDVSVENCYLGIRAEADNALDLKGETVINNNLSGNDKYGSGIAVLSNNENQNTVINVDGNLESYNFVLSNKVSNIWKITVKNNNDAYKFTFNNQSYINPLIVHNGNGTIKVNVTKNSNLYEKTSLFENNDNDIFTYDCEKVNEKNADLAYLCGTPDDYVSKIGFESFKYVQSGNYVVTDNGNFDFSNIKFKKYEKELSYSVTAFRVYTEDDNTTVYEMLGNCFDNENKIFIVPSNVSDSDDIYVIFEVDDIYDNNVYTDYNIMIVR